MKITQKNVVIVCLVCLVAAPSIVRAELITTLFMPTQPVPSGASIIVEVVMLNRGDTLQSAVSAATLSGTLTVAGHAWPVELSATQALQTPVAPNSFVLQPYTISLPAGVAGKATLHISRPGQSAITGMIDVVADAGSPRELQKAPADRLPELRVDEADTRLGRVFAGRLNVHNPIYIVYGNGDQAAKFQISFKYRLATFSEKLKNDTLSTFQFGYTQRSLWDIDADSSPFFDTSYLPELFWEWYNLPQGGEPKYGALLGLQSGILHESNGRDGTDSRSLNSVFVRVAFTFGPPDGWNLKLIPQAWVYTSLDEVEGIDDYRGYAKLEAILGKADSFALRFSLAPGKDFDRLSYQLDLSLPVHVALFDQAAFLQVQYFTGYGESLRAYDEQTEALRVGISLTR